MAHGAINYDQEDEIVTEEVGAIIVATGYGLLDQERLPEYGGGRYPDVITGIQYERLLNASGPTPGHINVRPTAPSRKQSCLYPAQVPAISRSACHTAPTSAACT